MPGRKKGNGNKGDEFAKNQFIKIGYVIFEGISRWMLFAFLCGTVFYLLFLIFQK